MPITKYTATTVSAPQGFLLIALHWTFQDYYLGSFGIRQHQKNYVSCRPTDPFVGEFQNFFWVTGSVRPVHVKAHYGKLGQVVSMCRYGRYLLKCVLQQSLLHVPDTASLQECI